MPPQATSFEDEINGMLGGPAAGSGASAPASFEDEINGMLGHSTQPGGASMTSATKPATRTPVESIPRPDADQLSNDLGSKSYWLGDSKRPGAPSVWGGLKNDLASLWSGFKSNFVPAASPQVPDAPTDIKLVNPLAGAGDALDDPLGAMYSAGPFTSALTIASGAEGLAAGAEGVAKLPTRGRTVRALTSLPDAPGTALEAGTKLADRAARAPEAARQRGVAAYDRIKEGPLGKTFVPDVPESEGQAQLRLTQERLRTEPRPTTFSSVQDPADARAEAAYNTKRADKGLRPQTTTQPSGRGGLSSVTPDQVRATAGANPTSDLAELRPYPGITDPDQADTVAQLAQRGRRDAAAPRSGVSPDYQQELDRVGTTFAEVPPPPKGQSLSDALDAKSNLGRRESGMTGPRLSSTELAQAHKTAEAKLIRAVQNSGQDATPLIEARAQYAKAKQVGRTTAGVRAQVPGSLVDSFSDPNKIATMAKKVKVYETTKAPRVQDTAGWFKDLHDVAPEELDGVMAHAEAKIIEGAVDPRAQTIDGPKLKKVLKAYEDQGLRLPHHDQIAQLADTATSKGYDTARTKFLKPLAASLIRNGLKGSAMAGGGYALYHWMRE